MSDTLLSDTRTYLLADSALATLIDSRLYPSAAPEGQCASASYIVYQEVSLVTDLSLAGATGLRECRVQYDCYSKSKSEAFSIRERILAVFNGYFGTPVVGGVNIHCAELSNLQSEYNHEEEIYSYRLDITYHYTIN